MKKLSIVLLSAALCFAMLKPQAAMAQKEKGQSVVTVGAGASLVGILFKAITTPVNSSGGSAKFSSTPAILAMYDFGVTDRFSIGAAFSYQSFTGTFTDWAYDNSLGGVSVATFKDRVTRLNYAVRPLFHLGNNDDMDMYIGPRIGMTQWTFSSNNPDPYYDSGDFYDGFTSRIRVQVLYGIRYFFNEHIGLNGEIAIGTPYYMMGGINFKF